NEVIERRSKQLGHSAVADDYPAGEVRVPSNYVVTAALLAMNKGGKRARALQNGFTSNDLGCPTFRYEPTPSKRILVYPTPADFGKDQSANAEKLWQCIEA